MANLIASPFFLGARSKVKWIPDGYLQCAGLPNSSTGSLVRAGTFIIQRAEALTHVDVGVWDSHVITGKEKPHTLLATGAIPAAEIPTPGLGTLTDSYEGAVDGEGAAVFVPGFSYNARGPEGGQPKVGTPLTQVWKLIFKDSGGEPIGEGTLKIKFTRLEGATEYLFFPICTTAPLALGKRTILAPNEAKEPVEHNVEELTAIPVGTRDIETVQEGGGAFFNFTINSAGFNSEFNTVLTPTPSLPPGPDTYFIGVIPRGGGMYLPLTADGPELFEAKDRHGLGIELVNDPAVVGAGEGTIGTDSVSAFGIGSEAARPAVESLL